MPARAMSESPIACATGDNGCANSTVMTAAEIMKRPSRAPSIRYSGQWLRSARDIDIAAIASASRVEAGVQRHAAVDHQARAGDVVRIVGGDPRGRAPDLVG